MLLLLVAFACLFGSHVVPQNPYDLSQVTFMDLRVAARVISVRAASRIGLGRMVRGATC